MLGRMSFCWAYLLKFLKHQYSFYAERFINTQKKTKISQNDLDGVASASLITKCVSWKSETCGWWLVEEARAHSHTN